MRRQRNVSLMKGEDKAPARDLSETDVCNMPDTEFTAMIERMCSGLEKRVEDLSETLTQA